jgi:hypothetical protein
MAARTLTVTANLLASPKALHAGLNTIVFDFNSGTGKLGTVSDVVLLGKIPNGALVTGVDIRFGAELSAATTWTLLLLAQDANGTYTTHATLVAAGSITANATTAQSYRVCSPVKVSLSDDRAIQYVTLALNCTVGGSETVSFSFQGQFLTDGSTI